MADGTKRIIENVKTGEMVQGFDFATGRIVTTKVLDVLRDEHPRSSYYVINRELKITNDHPIAVAIDSSVEWIEIDELQIGDKLKSIDNFVEVETIELVNAPAITAHLETEIGNFMADGSEGPYIVKGWKTY